MSKIVSKLKLVLRVTKRAGKSLIKNKGNVKIHGNSPYQLLKIVGGNIKKYGIKDTALRVKAKLS
jgi:hypothetical protein